MQIQKRVKASGPRDARLAVVGMAPSYDELRTGMPFTGPSGRLLNEGLSLAAWPREKTFVTNVCEFPISGPLGLVPSDLLTTELARLKTELEAVNPNCVLVLGEPFEYLTDKKGILKWRGSILPSILVPGKKCVVSTHPAWLLRGMMKWKAVFQHVDVKRAVEEAATPEIKYPERKTIMSPSLNLALEYINALKGAEKLSVDIETYGTDNISCIGLGASANEAICVPFTFGGGRHYWSTEEECRIWRGIAELLESPIPKIGQNFSFEWIFFWLHSIYPRSPYIDTMLLHHCLYPDFGGAGDVWGLKRTFDEPGHGLAFINSQYTKTPYYKDDGRKWTPKMGDEAFWNYNGLDVMVTFDAAMQMEQEAKESGLWDFYQEFYMRPFLHTIRVEWEGIGYDVDRQAKAREECIIHEGELQRQIDDALGYHLNVASTKQMQELLYDQRGYQVKKNRKTGRATADKTTLQYFAAKKGDNVLNLILELKKARDLRSDVLEAKVGRDKRMRCHYKQGGTDGARWSSTKSILGTGTNLQNVPKKGIARKLFLPV